MDGNAPGRVTRTRRSTFMPTGLGGVLVNGIDPVTEKRSIMFVATIIERAGYD
jgi:hypothetical protein